MNSKVEEIKIAPRLLTVRQAGSYLSRSPWTVAQMLRLGKLPFIEDGKRRFIDIEDLNEWIRANKKRDLERAID